MYDDVLIFRPRFKLSNGAKQLLYKVLTSFIRCRVESILYNTKSILSTEISRDDD
jgi:hypothetical protein